MIDKSFILFIFKQSPKVEVFCPQVVQDYQEVLVSYNHKS